MRITVELFAATGSFETDFKRASKTAQKEAAAMQRSLTSAAKTIAVALTTGIAANWIKNAVRDSIEFASTMHDVSEQTGIAVEELSVLEFAATKSGIGLEDLRGGLSKFSKTIAEAASGSKAQAALFNAIGVSLRDANGNLKGTGQLLTEVAGKFASYSAGPEKAALSQEFFSKSGTALIPFLNTIGPGLDSYKKRVEELGLVLDTETINAQEQFGDELQTSSDLTRKLKLDMTRDLLPVMQQINNAFIGAAKSGGGFETFARGIASVLHGAAVAGSYLSESIQLIGNFIASEAAVIKTSVESIKNLKLTDLMGGPFGNLGGLLVKMSQSDFTQAKGMANDTLDQYQQISDRAEAFRAALNSPFKRPDEFVGPPRELMNAPLVGGDGGAAAAKEALKERKALFEQAAAQAEAFAALEKSKDDERLAALEDNFARGLTDFKEYYAQRYVLTEAASEREAALIQGQIESTKALRDEAKEKSEQITLDTKLLELEGKLKVAQEEAGNDHLASLREQNNAIDEQRRALADLAADAALSRGERAVGSRGADLEQARRMRQVSDEEYYRALADLEDAHYSNLVEREEAARAAIHGSELDQIRAREEINDRIESIEGEHQERLTDIQREAAYERASIERELQESIRGDFETFFEDILSGNKSLKDSFKDLADDIIKEIERAAAKQLVKGLFGDQSEGTSGGWVGAAFDWFKSVDWGGGKASGGPVSAGTAYMVGEHGREIFVPKASGEILSHGASQRVGSGGHTFNMPITIMAPESRLDRRSINQVRYAMGAGVSESMRSLG